MASRRSALESMKWARLLAAGWAVGALSSLGCEPGVAPPPDARTVEGTGPAIGVPPLLDPETHPGWGNPQCALCHTLPAPGHTVTQTFVCAQCHGANGACLPNGFNPSYNAHTPADDCASCHDDAEEAGVHHGFEDDAVCANCHFRELGQRGCEDYAPPDVAPGAVPPVGTAPALSSALRGDCLSFPEQPFSAANSVPDGREWRSLLQPGDQAVEVRLRDVDGTLHSLSELLAERPVWLQTGSYTCPVYQNAVRSALNPLFRDGNEDGPYAEQITLAHVYTVEAHPAPPDYSPYGSTRVLAYSTLRQPTTYEARLANALVMEPIAESELMLLDTLAPLDPVSNQVWCTYGTCPACSYLIGRDGIIHEVIERTPDDAEELRAVLDAFLRAF